MPNNRSPLNPSDLDCTMLPAKEIFNKLNTSKNGLSDEEATKRRVEYGYNEPAKRRKRTILFMILSKFVNPLVAVLVIIALFSFFFGEKIEAMLVTVMAVMSVLLSFIQEYKAGEEAERLRFLRAFHRSRRKG